MRANLALAGFTHKPPTRDLPGTLLFVAQSLDGVLLGRSFSRQSTG